MSLNQTKDKIKPPSPKPDVIQLEKTSKLSLYFGFIFESKCKHEYKMNEGWIRSLALCE